MECMLEKGSECCAFMMCSLVFVYFYEPVLGIRNKQALFRSSFSTHLLLNINCYVNCLLGYRQLLKELALSSRFCL